LRLKVTPDIFAPYPAGQDSAKGSKSLSRIW
jgi:hypothetical protein